VIVHLDTQVFSEASLVLFLARLRQQYGVAALATYSDVDVSAVRLLACAIRFGVHTTWLRGHDQLAARLQEFIERNCASAVAAQVLAAIDPVPASIRLAVSGCLHHAFSDVLTVGVLGKEMSAHRRTLVNRFRAAGYPSPGAFITWSRLLVSARLLDDPSISVSDVTRWLHFVSPSQYRGMLRRYAGLTPTEMRHHGALATLAERFRRYRSRVRFTATADNPVSFQQSGPVALPSRWMTG
jgi:AraC-like DNA-binding protein